jgi:hypothetical protein
VRGCFASAIAAAVLSDPLAAARNGTIPVFDVDRNPADQAPSYIDVEGHKRLPRVGRLAIVSFTVEFVDSREATTATARKGSNKGKDRKPDEAQDGNAVAAEVAIALDSAQLQPIVDALYDVAVEDWRAAGAEVIDARAMHALPGFADLEPALVSTPYRRESSDPTGKRTAVVVAAHSLPAYAQAGESPPLRAEIAVAQGAAVTLLTAHLVVDFLALRDTDERVFRKKLAPMYLQMVRAGDSVYRLIGADGHVTRAVLRNPVRAPESPINPAWPGGYVADDEQQTEGNAATQRLSINTAIYYDQSLRYLGATQEMMFAALGLH